MLIINKHKNEKEEFAVKTENFNIRLILGQQLILSNVRAMWKRGSHFEQYTYLFIKQPTILLIGMVAFLKI